MTVEMKYNRLCEEFLSATQSYIDDKILKVLKEKYMYCINSERKLSQINDLRTLLKILEKRDVLNYSNVEPLAYISNNILHDSHLQNNIEVYKFQLKNMQYLSIFNMYQDINTSIQPLTELENNDTKNMSNKTENCTLQPEVQSTEPKCQSLLQGTINFRVCSEQELILQQTVLSQISERIGRSWRDTVRYLGIPEYQIDIIQNKHPNDMKEQSYEALKLYVSQYNTDNWKLNLIHALEKARRRDLKELAEKLILRTRIE